MTNSMGTTYSYGTTTIVLHSNNTDEPLIYNLKGIHLGPALYRAIRPLVYEHFEPNELQHEAEILFTGSTGKVFGLELDLRKYFPDLADQLGSVY